MAELYMIFVTKSSTFFMTYLSAATAEAAVAKTTAFSMPCTQAMARRRKRPRVPARTGHDRQNDDHTDASAPLSSAAWTRSLPPDGRASPMRARHSVTADEGAPASNPRTKRPASFGGEAWRK